MEQGELGSTESKRGRLKKFLGSIVQYIPGLNQQTESQKESQGEVNPSSIEIARNLGSN